MKKINVQLTLVLMIICQLFRAQDRPMEDYSIAKRVNISNDYNSGKPSIAIPLYNIDIENLNLSSSLEYINNLVIGEPALTGTNWDVNLFGKIILQSSSGEFDPIPNKQSNGFYTNVGSTCFLRETMNITKKQMLDNPNENIRMYFSPNKYYFEFLGYRGTFLSDNVGNILVSSDYENLKVTFNGNRCYNAYAPISSSLPEIVIEDNKGNKFYFGGDYNSLDINYAKNKYTYSNMVQNGGNVDVTEYSAYRRKNYINAFYLRKIELNNGKIIEAFYKNGNRNLLNDFTNGGYYFGNDYAFIMPSKSTLRSNNLFVGVDKTNDNYSGSDWNTSTSSGFTRNKTDTYQKVAILDSIKIFDYATLNFSYNEINNDLTKPFLKRIQLKNNNKIIKDIDFNYIIKNKRVFLEHITSNAETYIFNYYDEDNERIINSNSGLISKIIYPTNGFDTFEYEQHDASKVTSSNSFSEIQDAPVPGKRLKSIKTYNNTQNYIEKKYSYKGDNGKSSGITNSNLMAPQGSASDPLATFSTIGGYYHSLYGPYIEYSKVTEEIANKGKSEFYFTDLTTNPDSLNVNKYATYSSPNYGATAIYISKATERGKLFLTKKYDNNNTLIFQETIKYKNFLNSAGTKKEISNTCLDCKISDYQFYIKASMSWDIFDSQKVAGLYTIQPVLPFLPSSITTKELTSDKLTFLETTKDYEYNDKYLYWHSNPVKITTNINGQTTNTIYNYYPGDILKTGGCYTSNCNFENIDKPGRKMLTYKQMIDDNVNLPILTLSKNNDNKFLLKENIFEKVGTTNKYRLASERINEINTSFNETNFENATVFETRKYEVYDNQENLVQSTPQSGIPTTTIWGYRQTQPIAKIEGATYAQVMQAFNLDPNDPNSYLQLEIVKKSDTDKDDISENELISKLVEFKNNYALKDYLVTTYTYDPLIGVKTITNSTGIKEYYKYDSANRLEKILNNDNKTIKEFKYNYIEIPKYLNSLKSQTFTRNNCTYIQVPTNYTYTVPQGTYISYTSQAVADQTAQEDINFNGQDMTNNYATCNQKPFDCTVNTDFSVWDNGATIFNQILNNNYNSYYVMISFNTKNINWNLGTSIKIGNINGICKPVTTKFIPMSSTYPWNIKIDTDGVIYASLFGINTINPNKRINIGFEVPFSTSSF